MGALIFIPNVSLIIFFTHDIKVKSVDEQPFIFDEFLTFFLQSLGSRVNIDYISSKSPTILTESAFQAYRLYLGAGKPTKGHYLYTERGTKHRHKTAKGHTNHSCTPAHWLSFSG